MSDQSSVFVGAAAAGSRTRGGLYRKRPGDDAWEQVAGGLPHDTQVQAITVHPADSRKIYAGTHTGPFRSTDGGDTWQALALPEPGLQVWSILVHPSQPETLYAGTSPVGVFRSDDGGNKWRKLMSQSSPDRVKMAFPCRVMRLAADPANPDELYATLEVGGVMRSLNGGESWEDCSTGLIDLANRPHLKSMLQSDTDIEGMMDGHALCVSGAQAGTIFLAVRMGLFRSADRGVSWEDMEVGRFSPLTYSRDVRVSPQEPRTLYACFSPAARSEDGSVYRSHDLGETWTRFDHGIKAEATMMAVALHLQDPEQVHCVSRSGQVFSTTDGGASWSEAPLPEGVRDVYAVACT
jgi:photosystem II stability/assembly factor-like uncharacterized protein